jgi:hypothetical protein
LQLPYLHDPERGRAHALDGRGQQSARVGDVLDADRVAVRAARVPGDIEAACRRHRVPIAAATLHLASGGAGHLNHRG